MTRLTYVTLIITLAAGSLAACGNDNGLGPGDTRDSLIFERADGTRIEFGGTTRVWCGPWEPGEVPAQSIHVVSGSSRRGWSLTAVVDDIAVGQPLTFPNTFIWNEPRGADLFVLDPPNEASTQSSESSGQIVFQALNCRAGLVGFTIDAVVGSEFGNGPPVRVRGSFSGHIGSAP